MAKLQTLLAPWRHSGLPSPNTTLQVTWKAPFGFSKKGQQRSPTSLNNPQPLRAAHNSPLGRSGPAHVPPSVGGDRIYQPGVPEAFEEASTYRGEAFPQIPALPSRLSFVNLPDQQSSLLARPEVETPAPCTRSRKYRREAHTRRKPSSGHAHLPEAPEVFF